MTAKTKPNPVDPAKVFWIDHEVGVFEGELVVAGDPPKRMHKGMIPDYLSAPAVRPNHGLYTTMRTDEGTLQKWGTKDTDKVILRLEHHDGRIEWIPRDGLGPTRARRLKLEDYVNRGEVLFNPADYKSR